MDNRPSFNPSNPNYRTRKLSACFGLSVPIHSRIHKPHLSECPAFPRLLMGTGGERIRRKPSEGGEGNGKAHERRESELPELLNQAYSDFGGISDLTILSKLDDTQLTDEILATVLEDTARELTSPRDPDPDIEGLHRKSTRKRPTEGQDLSYHIVELNSINSDLKMKIRMMQEKILSIGPCEKIKTTACCGVIENCALQ